MRTFSLSSIALVGLVVMSAGCASTEERGQPTGVQPDENARIGQSEGPIVTQLGDVAFENCQATARFAVDARAKELQSLSVSAAEMMHAVTEVSLFQVDEAHHATLMETASLHRVAAAEETSIAEESAAAAAQRSAVESHTSTVRTGSSASVYEEDTAVAQTSSRSAAHRASAERAAERAAASEHASTAAEEARIHEAARAEAAVAEHASVASRAAEGESAHRNAFVTDWGGLGGGLLDLFGGMSSRSAHARAAESAAAGESASLQSAAAQEQAQSAQAASRRSAHEAVAAEEAAASASAIEESVVSHEALARERVTHAAAAEETAYATESETRVSEFSEAEMAGASRRAAHSAIESEDVASSASLQESAAASESAAEFEQLDAAESQTFIVEVVFDAAALAQEQVAAESSAAGASSYAVPLTFIGGLSAGGIGINRTLAPSIPITGCL